LQEPFIKHPSLEPEPKLPSYQCFKSRKEGKEKIKLPTFAMPHCEEAESTNSMTPPAEVEIKHIEDESSISMTPPAEVEEIKPTGAEAHWKKKFQPFRFAIPTQDHTPIDEFSKDGNLHYLDVPENGLDHFRVFAKQLVEGMSIECAEHSPCAQALTAHRNALSQGTDVGESLATRLATQRRDGLATLQLEALGVTPRTRRHSVPRSNRRHHVLPPVAHPMNLFCGPNFSRESHDIGYSPKCSPRNVSACNPVSHWVSADHFMVWTHLCNRDNRPDIPANFETTPRSFGALEGISMTADDSPQQFPKLLSSHRKNIRV